MSSDTYPTSESKYWNSYSSSGELKIANSSDSLSLSFLSGVSYKDHPTCYWSIYNPSLSQITLNIKRSPSNYEDVYIVYLYNSIYYYLSTKEIARCSSDSVTYILRDIERFTVKVKRLSSLSDYSININNPVENSSQQTDYTILIIIFSVLGFLIILLIVMFPILWLWSKREERILREKLRYCPPNIKYVDETLGKMTSCPFKHWEPKYRQDTWVVWLELFTPESQINITNEWNHIFHSECLRTWFMNIRGDKKLTWPHCSTENSPKSQPLESCEFPSIASFHAENLPSPVIWTNNNNQIEENQIYLSDRV